MEGTGISSLADWPGGDYNVLAGVGLAAGAAAAQVDSAVALT
jgi:hypothetical protein